MQAIKILTISKPVLQYLLTESTWHCISDIEVKVYVKFHAICPQKHKTKTQREPICMHKGKTQGMPFILKCVLLPAIQVDFQNAGPCTSIHLSQYLHVINIKLKKQSNNLHVKVQTSLVLNVRFQSSCKRNTDNRSCVLEVQWDFPDQTHCRNSQFVIKHLLMYNNSIFFLKTTDSDRLHHSFLNSDTWDNEYKGKAQRNIRCIALTFPNNVVHVNKTQVVIHLQLIALL